MTKVGITNNANIKYEPDTKRGTSRDGFGLHPSNGRRALHRKKKLEGSK